MKNAKPVRRHRYPDGPVRANASLAWPILDALPTRDPPMVRAI